MACLPQYLQRRGNGTFHFRLAVPSDLRPLIRIREIKRSLGTKDPAVALALAHRMRKTIADAFAECRAVKTPKDAIHLLTFTVTHADGRIQKLEVDRSDPNEEAEIAERALRALNTDDTAPLGSGSARAKADLLSTVVQALVQERQREDSWTEKTIAEHQATFSLLIEILGDKAIAAVDKADARKFKEILQTLPPNRNKNPRYRGLSLDDLLTMRPFEKTISIPTFNKHISTVSSLFNWAQKHGYCLGNPFAGISLKTPNRRGAHEDRDVFSEDDLEKLFGTPVFQEKKFKHAYYYWLPLLGLYSGARLNELAQLAVDDIRQEEGIWVMSINASINVPGKRLKTASSERVVPLHSKLLELGFLELVDNLRAQAGSGGRVFSELPLRRDGYGHDASKWFARYREQCGVSGGKKVFHSFRHTFANHLKQSGCDRLRIQALLGHKDDSLSTGTYGKPFGVSKLKETIEVLQFTCGSLARLEQ